MPAFAISLKQVQHGEAVVYNSLPSIDTPFLAACKIAFASACTVVMQ